MAEITKEQFEALKSKGWSDAEISSNLAQYGMTAPGRPGVLPSIGEAHIQSERGFGESIAGSSIGRFIDRILPGQSAAEVQEEADIQNLQTRQKAIEAKKLDVAGSIPEYEGMSAAEKTLRQKTRGQVIGEAIGTAADVISFSSGLKGGAQSFQLYSNKGNQALIKALAANTFTKSEPLVKATARQAFQLGAKGAGIGYMYDVAHAMQNNETDFYKPGLSTALGAALPVVMTTAKGLYAGVVGKDKAAASITKMLHPNTSGLSYGKDPGYSIVHEGIVANSWDDLAEQVATKRAARGQEIGQIGSLVAKKAGTATMDASKALGIVDDALDKAAKTNNQEAFNRLSSVRRALAENLAVSDGAIVSTGKRNLTKLSWEQMTELRQAVGDMARWTGNASDDKLVNGVVQDVYRSLRGVQGDYVTKFGGKAVVEQYDKANMLWGSLQAAEKAIQNKEILLRKGPQLSIVQNIGLMGAVTALFTGKLNLVVPSLLAALGVDTIKGMLENPAGRTRIAAVLGSFSAEIGEDAFRKFVAQHPQIFEVIHAGLREDKVR